jgi:3-methyl-2-oxobutanoate hydroxymethyltransferase
VKTTVQTIRACKRQRPIVAVTAYDAIFARLASEAGVDLLLVGDSVGTTALGFETTVPVTLAMMLHHTAAVARARPQPLLVADVPFGEAHYGFDRLLEACQALMQQGGAEAVKIEGGAAMADKISRLVAAGIPVLGHIGLLPQQVHALGGYRRFGKAAAERQSLLADARALEAAGVFAVVGEMIEGSCAGELRQALNCPLIGIGCGPDCDGQILVSTDLLGLNAGKVPSFVQLYAQLGQAAREAIGQYAAEVRSGTFPPRKG